MKPAAEISDRAKRYRANEATADWPQVCLFCGSTKDLQVDHLDGFEENGEPENLLILCRSCNQLKAAVYKQAGMGRRTVQYNPGLLSRLFGPRETYRAHGAAHPESLKARRLELDQRRLVERERAADEREEKRREKWTAPQSVGRYKGFTLYKRHEAYPDRGYIFYSSFDPDSWLESLREAKGLIDTYKNPASSFSAWRDAVGVLRGEKSGSPFKAARTVRSTPVHRRYGYLDRMMRANPKVPTFEQYAYAVSTHQGREYIPGRGFTVGAHDEGGAIIHATPKAKRREYAAKIADRKRGRREEVPF